MALHWALSILCVQCTYKYTYMFGSVLVFPCRDAPASVSLSSFQSTLTFAGQRIVVLCSRFDSDKRHDVSTHLYRGHSPPTLYAVHMGTMRQAPSAAPAVGL